MQDLAESGEWYRNNVIVLSNIFLSCHHWIFGEAVTSIEKLFSPGAYSRKILLFIMFLLVMEVVGMLNIQTESQTWQADYKVKGDAVRLLTALTTSASIRKLSNLVELKNQAESWSTII